MKNVPNLRSSPDQDLMEIPTSPTNYSPPPGSPGCDPPTPWEAECCILTVLNAMRMVGGSSDDRQQSELERETV